MRHHDIERLKQAASRYKADATCLCDIEELTDYAIDKLDEPIGDNHKQEAAFIARRCVDYYHGGYGFGPEYDAYKHGMRTVARSVMEWAGIPIDLPPTPNGVHKVDNGDGTETWHGLPVVVPVGLVPDGETPVEVRSRDVIPATGSVRAIKYNGEVGDVRQSSHGLGDLRIILAAKPQPVTWTPPASLSDGDYKWNGSHFSKIGKEFCVSKSGGMAVMFRDWTDPPRCGLYKVESGTATWSGE